MASGENCADPIVINPNDVYVGTTQDAGADFAFRDVSNCQGNSSTPPSSPDQVFQVTIPANNRFTAELNTADGGLTGSTWDSILNLVPAPAANCGTLAADGGTEGLTCLAGADNGNPERVAYYNSGTAPLDVFIMVKGYFNNSLGRYTLTTTSAPPPPGDTCPTAIVLVPGVALMGETLTNLANDYGTGTGGCGTPNAGVDRIYSVDVPNNQRLRVTVSPTGFDSSISLMDSLATCNSATCIANGGTTGSGVPETAYYVNTTGSTQTIYVRVDSGSGSSGTYDIIAVVDSPPTMGDTCNAPIPLVAGMTLMGETTDGYTADYSGTGMNCSFDSAGPDKVYSISVPVGQQLRVTVTPVATFNTSVSIALSPAASCTSRTCASNANNGGAGVADVATYLNTTSQPVSVFIIVDSAATVGGAYDIVATLGPPPYGEVCLNPIILDGGTLIDAGTNTYPETLIGATNDYTGVVPSCASGTTSGPDKVYAIDTPAGSRTIVVAAPATGAGVSISLLANAMACDSVPRVCINAAEATTSTGAAGTEAVATYNFGGTTSTTLAIVDSASSVGNFQFTTITGVPPAGEVCENTDPPITMAGTTSATTLGYFSDYYGGSGSLGNGSLYCVGTTGPDRVHAITVPAMTNLTATVQPDAGFNVAVDLFGSAADCTGRRLCAAASNLSSTNGVAETVRYNNTGAAPATVYVSVDGVSATGTGSGNYDLNVAYGTIPPGDTCANAVPITMSGTISGESTLTYANDIVTPIPTTNCSGSTSSFANSGADKIYSVTLTAGQVLTATVTPVAGFDPAILLLANCVPSTSTCLAGDDVGTAGSVDELTYTNNTGSMQTVYVVVDRFTNSGAGGSYSLTINIQ